MVPYTEIQPGKVEISSELGRAGVLLPSDYLNLLREVGAGYLAPNVIEGSDDVCIDQIYDLQEAREVTTEVFRDRMLDNCWAFAATPTGNQLVLAIAEAHGLQKGRIYEWDHEQETTPATAQNLSLVASSFSDMLNNLAVKREVQIEDFPLTAKQVQWIREAAAALIAEDSSFQRFISSTQRTDNFFNINWPQLIGEEVTLRNLPESESDWEVDKSVFVVNELGSTLFYGAKIGEGETAQVYLACVFSDKGWAVPLFVIYKGNTTYRYPMSFNPDTPPYLRIEKQGEEAQTVQITKNS